jgi:UDP-xylose/UDP-N-acetylglucosamine transporter B4
VLIKRYTIRQVWAIALLTFGVTLATISTANSQRNDLSSYRDFVLGISILVAGQLTATSLGLLIEVTYTHYGSHWREGLFYTV